MRVDLLIESGATSPAPWSAMVQGLLRRAAQDPQFSAAAGTRMREDGVAGHLIELSLCTMAADIVPVMRLVFDAIESTGKATGAPVAVRLDGGLRLTAGQWLAAFQATAATAIAAALSREGDCAIGTPDDVRRLFERVTGQACGGAVRQEIFDGKKRYSMAMPDGSRLFAQASPLGRGWVVIDSTADGVARRLWTTAPQYQHFSQCLMLEHCFADVDTPLELAFSHATLHDIGAGINRNCFSSALGPLTVHSRESATDRSLLQMVIEIPRRGEIRGYVMPRGVAPQTYELLPALPF